MLFPNSTRNILNFFYKFISCLSKTCDSLFKILSKILYIYSKFKFFLLKIVVEFVDLIINLLSDNIEVSLNFIEVIIDKTKGFTDPREVWDLLNFLNPIGEGRNPSLPVQFLI